MDGYRNNNIWMDTRMDTRIDDIEMNMWMDIWMVNIWMGGRDMVKKGE